MNLVISILSLCFLLQSAFSTDELPRLYLSKGHIISYPLKTSRNLDAYFIDFSFIDSTAVIPADFGAPFYEKNNGTNQTNTLMAVTISSNETVFFGNFSEGMDFFNCEPSYCTHDNSSSTHYTSTWFNGNVTQITLNTNISIAFGAWQLATPALYMAEAPEDLQVTEQSVYGSIGLGTGSGAQGNFYGDNPLFSIFYNQSSSTGDLIFGYNATYANTSKPSMTVTSDPNWQMQLASISVGNQTVYTVNETKPIYMLFDFMTMGIDFPADLLANITNGIGQLGFNCYSTGCTASNLTGVPPIVFTLADNTQLTLNPDIYMLNADGDASTDVSDSSGSSDATDATDSPDPSETIYITEYFDVGALPYFDNKIVFGTYMLSQYYTVFQQTNGSNTITLYSVPDNITVEEQISPPITPDDSPDVSSTSNPTTHAIYILIAACVALVIVLVGAVILGIKRGWFKKKQASEESLTSLEMSDSQRTQSSRGALAL